LSHQFIFKEIMLVVGAIVIISKYILQQLNHSKTESGSNNIHSK
jgi:hypothetical protein